jgi:rhodanese-related sulfurtransferase
MYHDIFPEELKGWQQQGAALIDVRESYEYAQGHVPGAKNIPLSEFSARLAEVPDKVVLICASGNRSSQAAHYLGEHGYSQVANLMGGTFGWAQRGLPVDR